MSGRTVVAAGVLTAAAVGCGLALGTPPVPPAEFAGSFVVTELRLPRLVLALVAGACLGAAGLVLQEALRNPLAVPELLGVSSGAALAVVGPLVLAVSVPPALQPFLAIGGAAAGGALTLLAAGAARGPSAVLLCGAAVAAALQSALLVLMVLADQLDLQLIHRYLLGSLSARTWDDVTELLPWLVAAVPALVLCAPVLSVLRLGDDDARALGVRVHRARAAALAVAVVLIAPVVAVCGPVAWVGFLAPHLARRLAPGKDAVGWLPWSAVWGALIVAWADLPARLALAPVETPVGAWTALLGVPAGVLLLKYRPGGARPQRRAGAGGAAAGSGGPAAPGARETAPPGAAPSRAGHGPPPGGAGAGPVPAGGSGGPAPDDDGRSPTRLPGPAGMPHTRPGGSGPAGGMPGTRRGGAG